MPYEIPMLFEQSEEMLETIKGIWMYMISPFIIYIAVLGLIYILLKKSDKYLLKGHKLPISLIMIILGLGSIIASQRTSPYVFLPKVESTSIKNMYNVLSWSIAKEVPKLLGKRPKKKPTFLPYEVKKTQGKSPQTIIVVMGESLSAKYMSLYGFEKPTTPLLKKRENELLYTWGYSAGVNTDVSVPTFFLLKREPQNNLVFLKGNTNLFTLAKASGYKTHYITTQKLTVLGSFLGNSVDEILSEKDFKKENDPIYDEVLLNYLNNIDLTKRNFIVLHQRNSHSPYPKQTPEKFHKFPFKGKPYKEHMNNSYYNSLLYTDMIFDGIIETAKKSNIATAVFFTSDHSETMGNKDEEGRFGHSYLDLAGAKVPMIIYLNSKANYLRKTIKLKNIISHYQFSKTIARILGHEIINLNENNEYYINGVDISGSQGFISYEKKGKL